MREALLELFGNSIMRDAENVKLIVTDSMLVMEGCDKNLLTFMRGVVNTAVPELRGEAGVPNVGLLVGLLNFPAYNGDGAAIEVKYRQSAKGEMPTMLRFRGPRGAGADYHLKPTELIETLGIASFSWDIQFKPDKAKMTEIAQFTSLYKGDDKFGVRTKDGNLYFYIGSEDSSTHHATLLVAEGVSGSIVGDMLFSTSAFLSAARSAGANDLTIGITNRGAIGVSYPTPNGTCDLFLRAVTDEEN